MNRYLLPVVLADGLIVMIFVVAPCAAGYWQIGCCWGVAFGVAAVLDYLKVRWR
jgi:hypothetical protein